MSTLDTITGTVLEVIHHGHTVNGNPTMSVRLDSPAHSAAIPIRIQNDAGLVYEIENPEYRETAHTFALTRAGRISHVLRARCEVCRNVAPIHDRYCPNS